MKKIFLFIIFFASVLIIQSQVIYSNRYNNLALQTYSTANSSTQFTSVPADFTLIDDGLKNNIGSLTNPNRPFNEPSLKTSGWAVVYNSIENDTFLVTTSWLDTTTVNVNRWVALPPISNITENSVLTWVAKSPDANYADGYEVYGTTNLGTLNAQSFSLGDRLFSITDGNTSGGGEKNTWTRRSINLGAFVGQTLRFAFRNNSKDLYQLWIDDVEVINLPVGLDGSLTSASAKKYLLTNASDSVRVTIANLGATTIQSVTLSYQIGNSSVNTENFALSSGLDYKQSNTLKFSLPYSISQPGYYILKTWISAIDGIVDQNQLNDTVRYAITVQNTSPAKAVLLEQFVSANDGEGPDAQEKTLALQSNSVIAVNIHHLDSIKDPNSLSLISDYKKSFANAMVDRFYFTDLQTTTIDRPYYTNRVNERLNMVTPVSVSIINKTYNVTNNLLTFTIKADFVGEVKGDYRINAYIIENQVGGVVSDTTINGYNQLNNYYNIPWSPYYQKGYYSPTGDTYVLNLGQYRHQNALIYSFDGSYGNGGLIPTIGGTQNQSYQQTYTYTIPTPSNGINKFNVDNMYVVGFVAEYSTDKNARTVLNAVKEKITANPEVVSIYERVIDSKLFVYPNPSSGLVYFNLPDVNARYELQILDVLGRHIKMQQASYTSTNQSLDLSMLPDGLYVLKITSGKRSFSEKLIIQRN